jgi:hypothetical protein
LVDFRASFRRDRQFNVQLASVGIDRGDDIGGAEAVLRCKFRCEVVDLILRNLPSHIDLEAHHRRREWGRGGGRVPRWLRGVATASKIEPSTNPAANHHQDSDKRHQRYDDLAGAPLAPGGGDVRSRNRCGDFHVVGRRDGALAIDLNPNVFCRRH